MRGLHQPGSRPAPALLLSLCLFVGGAAAARAVLPGTSDAAVADVPSQWSLVYPVSQVARGAQLQFPLTAVADGEQPGRDVAVGRAAWGVARVPPSGPLANVGLKPVPLFAAGVAIVHRLPISGLLNLSQDALVAMFDGSLGGWADERIARHNPGLSAIAASAGPPVLVAPGEPVSGLTFALTSALAKMSPAWASSLGVFSDASKFPIPSANRSIGPEATVPQRVFATDWSYGLVDYATARAFGLPFAAVQNAAGTFVPPSVDSIRAAASAAYASSPPADSPIADAGNAPGPSSYPLAGTASLLLREGNPPDCRQAYEAVRFAYWTLRDPDALAILRNRGFADFPALAAAGERALGTVRCTNGIAILPQVQADIAYEQSSVRDRVFLICVCVAAGTVLLVALGSWLWFRHQDGVRREEIKDSKRTLVRLPAEVVERSQRELNDKVNVPVLEAAEKPAVGPTGAAIPVPADPVWQARIIRTLGGKVRAVFGPAPYDSLVWKPGMLHALRPASIGDTLTRAGRARRMSSAAAGAPRDEKGRVVQVAAPLAVRPFWQASYLSHVLVTLLRTLMDAAGLALNWVALYSLPEGVTLATAYGALCVIGSVLFVAHAATLWAAAMASRREDVDISRATLRGKERVMRHTLAFLKAELRRVKLACVREGVSRTSMLLREIPFIAVTAVLMIDSAFVDPFVLLGLCGNCVSLGFKARSLPMSLEDFRALGDLRDLYGILARAEGGAGDGVVPPDGDGEAEEGKKGGGEGAAGVGEREDGDSDAGGEAGELEVDDGTLRSTAQGSGYPAHEAELLPSVADAALPPPSSDGELDRLDDAEPRDAVSAEAVPHETHGSAAPADRHVTYAGLDASDTIPPPDSPEDPSTAVNSPKPAAPDLTADADTLLADLDGPPALGPASKLAQLDDRRKDARAYGVELYARMLGRREAASRGGT